MENNDLANIKEWNLLTDLLNKLPTKLQKGIFYNDLILTCVNVLKEFIALGTDSGVILWYNRKNGEMQRLRCETSFPITCLKIVSSVEFMVAAGNTNGQVNVFQIQKEHPPDLNLEPLTKRKPIERYTIRDLHRSPIKCVEWSKNGMKLFSGDSRGVVVLTEFDYQTHLSKSFEIINESYEIVQISFSKPWLLISTIYRAIICEKGSDGLWKVSQIGKKDRKVLSDFGAVFQGPARQPSIISTRPGFRFWIADVEGNVLQTLLFKDAVSKPCKEVPILNPVRIPIRLPINFGKIYLYLDDYIVTCSENVLYILNINKFTVEVSIKRLRKILDISIIDSEIFILEGPRTLIRIATSPESWKNRNGTIAFNPNPILKDPSRLFEPPIEIEVDEEAVVNAEECFELPSIKKIELETPLEAIPGRSEIPQSQKADLFERISALKFDDLILYKSQKKKKPKKNLEGIVEIGQQAETESCLTTKPCLLDVSYCESSYNVPDLRSPATLKKDIEIKEKHLAEILNIEPVKLEKIKSPISSDPLPYPFSIQQYNPHSTPLKKIHFISEEESPSSPSQLENSETFKNHSNTCDDVKNIMMKSDMTGYKSYDDVVDFPASSKSVYQLKSPDVVPDLQELPEFMNIPNLWNIRMVNDDLGYGGGGSGSDAKQEKKKKSSDSSESEQWEFIDI